MKTPSYPLFEPLKKEHKPLFDEAFRNFPPEISEFTFTNLYSWRHAYGFELSSLSDFIILRSVAGERYRFFNPLGSGGIQGIVKKILEESKGAFIRMPETAKILFNGEPGFNIGLDKDNSDYLFRVKDLILLQGRKYDGKRNLIKRFRQEYEYRFIEFNPSNVARCLEFEERWCSIKNCDSLEGLRNEKMAIKDMVSNFAEFNLLGGGIEMGGSMAALAIGERLNPDTLVMHILKADPDISGLYQVMLKEFLEKKSMGFEYINLEQDLGIEGIRKAKESYHPVRMIEKYTITRKE